MYDMDKLKCELLRHVESKENMIVNVLLRCNQNTWTYNTGAVNDSNPFIEKGSDEF